NTIPGDVRFSVDFRHRDQAVLDAEFDQLQQLINRVAKKRGVTATIDRFWISEPTPFDREVIGAVTRAMAELGLGSTEIWSGAGHDAKFLADICPTAMIFVRSRGGLSHCEQEFSTPDDLAAGVETL